MNRPPFALTPVARAVRWLVFEIYYAKEKRR